MAATDPTNALHHALTCADEAPLIVGFSGGLDSSVLLHALAQLPHARASGLRAVHVHHGLQAHADRWANHCQDLCDALSVTLHVVKATVERNGGEGLEAAARKARYAAFESVLMPGETLVTAHHRDDQAETFLMRALRGSGPDGLAAMRPWRSFANGKHWRPLLDVPRDTLHAYAQAHALDWLEDPSNADTHHDRNFLRARIMPLLRERWPHADAAFLRSAQLSADAVELLEPEDAHELALSRTADPHALSVPALLAMTSLRRARVLRRWIEELALPPLPREGIAHIESDLLPARIDASATFAWRDAVIHRWRDLLHAQRQRTPLDIDWHASWDGRQPLQLPNGDQLALVGADALPSPAEVSARRGGERITLPGRTHSHSLKHVMQATGIPPWERTQLPLLAESTGGPLIAVADLEYSAHFDAWLREHNARPAVDTGRLNRPALTNSAGVLTLVPCPVNLPPDASPVAHFEQSLDELEQLVEKMEHGEMSLEDSLAAYERGVGLYRRCQTALEQAELRVHLLSDPEHPESAEPFAPLPDGN